MKYLMFLVLLSGCCSLRHPLDGKAQSWCEAEPNARKACADHGGLGEWNPVHVRCKDETKYTRGPGGKYNQVERFK